MSPPSYSAQLYFYNLEFPDVRSMVHLVGKSNFYRWHAGIQPVLLSNAYSSNLILGTWTEPSGTPCPNPTPAGVASVGHDRDEWLAANTATCRFIRATLAMNVTPFVRQYKTAKTLFFNLVWLYGKDAGIDSQGGPPVPTNTEFWNPQKGRENLLAALEAKRAFDFLPPVQSAVPFPPRPSIPWVEVVRDGGASSCLLPRTTFTPVTTAITTTTTTKTANSPSPTIVTSQESDPEASDTPLTVVRILERTRVSPSPSLQTIHEHEHEEPHPGRRVPSGHIVDFDLPESVTDRSRGSVSPLSPSEASGVDDDDDDDAISSLEDLDTPRKDKGDSKRKKSKKKAKKGKPKAKPTATGSRKSTTTAFVSTLLRGGRTKKPTVAAVSKREKFASVLPLRRLQPTTTTTTGETGTSRGTRRQG